MSSEPEATPVEGAVSGEEPPPGDKTRQNGWHEITINTAFHVVGPRPCWVVKVGERYVRVPSVGRGLVTVDDKRFATRFDSLIWATTIAGGMRKSRIVRLWTKVEREIDAEQRKAADGPRRFAFGTADSSGRADGHGSAPEGEPPKAPATEGTTPREPATTPTP